MALDQAQSNLVDRVLRKMDALDAPGTSIVGSQGEVYAVLEASAREILLTAPARLMHSLIKDGKAAVNAEIVSQGLQAATDTQVPLPADFRRLLELSLSGWTESREQRDVHEESVSEYRRYLDGEKATTSEPVVFLSFYAAPSSSWTGRQVIHCFPGTAEEAAPVSVFYYIPTTSPESMPTDLTEAMLWLAASQVLAPFDPLLAERAEGLYRRRMEPLTERRTNVRERRIRPLGL